MTINRVTLLACCTITAACATSPSNLETTYVPPNQYVNIQCEDLRLQAHETQQRLNALHEELSARSTKDKVAFWTGVLIIPVTWFAIEGDDEKTEQYRLLKGQYIAMYDASTQNGCNTVLAYEDVVKQ